jgi:hypothetical protein
MEHHDATGSLSSRVWRINMEVFVSAILTQVTTSRCELWANFIVYIFSLFAHDACVFVTVIDVNFFSDCTAENREVYTEKCIELALEGLWVINSS